MKRPDTPGNYANGDKRLVSPYKRRSSTQGRRMRPKRFGNPLEDQQAETTSASKPYIPG
jgi:hypothetical protein